MDIQISRETRTQNEQTRISAVTALSMASAGPDEIANRATAAVALLAMWVVSEDEAEFGSLLSLALAITEDEIELVTDQARDFEFDTAMRVIFGD